MLQMYVLPPFRWELLRVLGRYSRTTLSLQKGVLPSFGIIAAMSQNRIIGIDDGLPWDLPADRRAFAEATSGKILVIGRRTLFEGSDLSHIAHTRQTIVVSRTLEKNDERPVLLARSLEEALQLAQTLEQEKPAVPDSHDWRAVDVWIGGGASLYAEALGLPSARFVRLTVLDTYVDVSQATRVAYFPDPTQWQDSYRLVSQDENNDSQLPFVTYLYERSAD
jgi:dihydrofolate reductase